jgi:hypothetical protein
MMNRTRTKRFQTRRQLLQTLAVGLGTAPLLSPLGPRFLSRAHAAEGGAPRRVILFENPNGLPNGPEVPSEWFFKPGATFESGVFGHMLKPLEEFRQDMVIIQNLEMKGDKNFKGPGTSDHRNANIMLYTGSHEARNPGRFYGASRNASIDWHMAQTLGKQTTPNFPLLLTGIQTASGESHTYMEDGDHVLHNDNPYDLYEKLFANLVTGSSEPDPALLARLARRQSVLDAVARDLTAFTKTLSAADRERAEIQLQAIRTLEQRLMPGASVSCSRPAEPPQALDFSFPSARDVPELASAMNQLVVAALSCDLTRIVSMLNWGGDSHHSTCNFAPINTTQGWHALSHLDPNVDALRRAKTWLSGVLAELVRALKSIPEGDGSMLDNTLILMAADHGQDHAEYGLLLCTIGGKNLGVKTGQYLNFGEPKLDAGLEHNRLLVSILNLMGLPDETWGEDRGRGPLPGFNV